jgi:NDP-sugar pyrophosphorylase family protein
VTDTGRVSKAILLAAGRGTRLGTLTADRPKPMIPVAGAPVLEHILRGLKSCGIAEFVVVVGYRAEAIRSYFGDGSRLGVQIVYATQEIPNGTGAALAAATQAAGGAAVLSSYGDILTDPGHYRALLADYEASPCGGVVGINPVDDPTAGAAVYRDGNRITQVVEKPPPGTAHSHWNLAGVNIFGPAIWDVLARLQPSSRGEYELTDAIAGLIAGGEEVRAVEVRGFWSDIGTPEALAEAEEAWRKRGGAQ